MDEDEALQLTAFDVAEHLYKTCSIVSLFIEEVVRPKLPNIERCVPAQQTVYLLLLRADCWMRTLRKCNEPLDFQAVATATRAILEVAIDLSLILEDENNAKKIEQWEESAKLKQALSLMQFYKGRRKTVPPELEYLEEFTRRNKVRIETIREENGWMKRGKPDHPLRWTGADLGADCIKATRAYPDFDFEEFYEVHHRELCWFVHGSGLTVVRGIESSNMPMLGGRFFEKVAALAEHVARITLKAFHLWTDATQVEFEGLARTLHLATKATLLGIKARSAADASQKP